jgi:hypothetical protein
MLPDQTLSNSEKLQQYQIPKREFNEFSEATDFLEQYEGAEKSDLTWEYGRESEQGFKECLVDLEGAKSGKFRTENIEQIFMMNNRYSLPDGDFDLEKAKKDYAEFLTKVPKKHRIRHLSTKKAFQTGNLCYTVGES